jgi:hypothetical protein
LISERTSLALQAENKRGVVLGVEQPYRNIAEQPTLRRVPMPRGGDTWNAMTVRCGC